MADVRIQPILMSGGSGTRLWPLSRQRRPKQFAPLFGDKSLFQDTVLRVQGEAAGVQFLPPVIVASALHAGLIRAQLEEIGVSDARLLLEPKGRDTAACAAAATLLVAADKTDALALLLPCDHVVTDRSAFYAALVAGAEAAAQGRIVTLGIQPHYPETAYGYIKAAPADGAGARDVLAFHEKPDAARAKAYLEEGGYSWNAGIFLFRPDTMIGEFEAYAPDILAQVGEALRDAGRDGDAALLDADAFGACRAQSLDRAVMEKTARASVVPVTMGWSDAGQWAAIWELSEKDANGLSATGNITAADARNCLVRSDGPLVALAGVEDLVVIAQDGLVLVTRRDAADSLKTLVEDFKASGRDELL